MYLGAVELNTSRIVPIPTLLMFPPRRIIELLLIDLKCPQSLKVDTRVLHAPTRHGRRNMSVLARVSKRRRAFDLKSGSARDGLPEILKAVVNVHVPRRVRVPLGRRRYPFDLPVVETYDILRESVRAASIQETENVCVLDVPSSAAGAEL